MQPHVPTSVALARLVDEAPPDHVSLAWLIGRLQRRSFGVLVLLLALLGLAPGVATFTGLLLVFPAMQMMLGRDSPTLPHFLARQSIPTRHVVRWSARVIPWLERMEALIRPRLRTPSQATKRLVGFIVLLLAATLVWPIPLSHIIPTLVIVMITVAYIEEDGILLGISLAAALLSICISAATVWAMVSAAGLIERMWAG